MIAVFWNIKGMKSITFLPSSSTFDKFLFVGTVLADIQKKLTSERPKLLGSGLYLHLDNTRPHFADGEIEKLGFRRMPHPPYSPDLAPSDFFLFGYLKNQLQGVKFGDEKELFGKVVDVLHSIPQTVLTRVYLDWKWKHRLCIAMDGEYVE